MVSGICMSRKRKICALFSTEKEKKGAKKQPEEFAITAGLFFYALFCFARFNLQKTIKCDMIDSK